MESHYCSACVFFFFVGSVFLAEFRTDQKGLRRQTAGYVVHMAQGSASPRFYCFLYVCAVRYSWVHGCVVRRFIVRIYIVLCLYVNKVCS